MESKTTAFNSIVEYIATFPAEVQKTLLELRATIQDAAPSAEEKISYQMPTFFLKGNLVHFAAYKNHIGFYATPSGHQEFSKELSKYKQGKGSVQFPLNQPIPYDLIGQIAEFRAWENNEMAKKMGH